MVFYLIHVLINSWTSSIVVVCLCFNNKEWAGRAKKLVVDGHIGIVLEIVNLRTLPSSNFKILASDD